MAGTPSGATWRDQALCSGADPAIFADPHPDTDDTRRAIVRSRSCPVRQPCLTAALSHHQDADIGIWGGTTADARREMRRRPLTPAEPEALVGQFTTLDGDLTDLSGRALVVDLPVTPSRLLFGDGRSTMRDHLDPIRHYLATLDDYQPYRFAALTIARNGDLTDLDGRITITRIPTPPHLLLFHDGKPRS